jgi:hypothetical protein
MNWEDIEVGHLFELAPKNDKVGQEGFICLRTHHGHYDVEYSWLDDDNILRWNIVQNSHVGNFNTLPKYWLLVCDHGLISSSASEEFYMYYTERLKLE